nr:hypothetical protein [uncultured Sellimonas sp.]
MERYLAAGKEYVRHHLPKQLLVSLTLFLLTPLFAGTRNLGQTETAQLLDFYAVLPGMLLLIPVFLPEADPNIRALIRSKYTSMGSIYLIRMALNILVMVILAAGFLWSLRAGNCQFPYASYLLAAMSGMLFLGGIGTLGTACTGNLVIGYMAAFGYYLFSFGAGEKYLGNWYLFSLAAGSYTEKRYLAMTGILLLGISVWIRMKKED